MRRYKLGKITDECVIYNSPAGTELMATTEQLIESNKIALFSREDRQKIKEASGLYHIENSRFVLWFGVLAAFYIISVISSTGLVFVAGHSFDIFGSHQSLAVLMFPLSFVFLDALSGTIGYKYARAAVLCGALAHVFVASVLLLTCLILDVGEYQISINRFIYLMLMGLVSLVAGDQTNNIIFRVFSNTLYNKKLWLRCLVSTICGQLICSIVWILSTVHNKNVWTVLSDTYLSNVVACVVLIPFTYVLVGFYKKHILGHRKRRIERHLVMD